MFRRALVSLAVTLGMAPALRIGVLSATSAQTPFGGYSEQPGILLLAVDDPTQSWVQMVTEGFREAVQATANPPVLYFEFLDAARFAEPVYLERFRDWLRDKYRDQRVDLVVPLGEDAVYFLAGKRGEPWPDVPVLFVEAGGLTFDIHHELPNAAGVILEDHFQAALAVIKTILPDTERVVIIYGASKVERMRFGGFADKLREASLGLEAVEFAGLPIEEILSRVAQLPERTVVFYANPQTDGSGRVLTTRQTCELITTAANRPTFSMPVEHVGCGVVGGLLRDFRLVGHLLGEQVLARLREPSSRSETITIPIASYTTLLFDARQLERWNIPERQLPAGSTVQFRQPNLWRDYRWEFGAAIAVGVLQTVLIAGLFVQYRRRLSAEVQARRHLAGMAHLERRAAMGQLTVSLAHELNQPLGAILRNAEAGKMLVASASPPPADEIAEIFEDIRRDDKRAGDVIRRMRTLLQKHELQASPVDVNDIARETVVLLAPDAVARGVRVDVELTGAPSMVTGDRVHLQQVLLNLVLNGMDAMAAMPPDRRRLLVRTTLNNGRVDVSVKDAGAGIPSEAVAKIFEPFFTTKAEGMGMGLSIARSIVEAHGGHIMAENNADGGATVRFSIPRQRVDESQDQKLSAQSSTQSSQDPLRSAEDTT